MKKSTASNSKIVWILGSLSTITPFAIDLYLPAFAQLGEDFGTNTATISLSVSSYFIGMALGQVLYGPFLDRFGRKPPLYVGLSLFVLASFGCTLSWDVTSLVVFRFLQAIGGSVAWVAAVAMVRDFFPVEASARIYSLLFLIIGVSPLLAPTIGGFIVTLLGWQTIFIFLMVITTIIVIVVIFFLPEGHAPDPTISLQLKPMLHTFMDIFKNPVFFKYVVAGAFSFSTLFIYVAGSPIIFMELYHVSPTVYGVIFALLSVGFIGGGQANILLTKKFSSEQVFRAALIAQVIASSLFLIGLMTHLLGLYGIIVMFFICLSCIGLTNPNGNALALAPFTRTVGSASALLGFIQIGVASVMSAGVGLFNVSSAIPSVALMCGGSVIAWIVLAMRPERSQPEDVNK